MERLEIYELVNKCETLEELSKVILEIGGESGLIQGRTKVFDANKMAQACLNYNLTYPMINTLTREFGIRQQAIYICTYTSFKM